MAALLAAAFSIGLPQNPAPPPRPVALPGGLTTGYYAMTAALRYETIFLPMLATNPAVIKKPPIDIALVRHGTEGLASGSGVFE